MAVRLTAKGAPANAHQQQNMALIVQLTKAKGGDLESAAGAIATAIQESNITNIRHGDRDSLGLFQQRPSMGWGSPAQVTNPTYAINKFLSIYLPYRRKGLGWMQASHKTQRSAHPSAPARWYGESLTAARHFFGNSGAINVDASGADGTSATTTETREKAYEFSRGSADKKETSWDCIGRLGDEVNWRRYSAAGELWFVSEDWLKDRPPMYRISETARGVLGLSFSFETRKEAAEANVRCVIGRYALAPGDVVELVDEGPADGMWLVASTRRVLTSGVQELTLKRPGAKLPEPAPEKETVTITVAGTDQDRANPDLSSISNMGARVYAAGQKASSLNWRYSQGRRNSNGQNQFADCSSGVSWVLRAAGVRTPPYISGNAPVSGAYLSWGQAGPGKFFTIYTHRGHIWIRWNGVGAQWRFDTGGGSGGRNWPTPRSAAGFVARHWPGL